MSTKTAMKRSGLKYFSSLTSNQKDETIQFIRVLKNDLNTLDLKLAMLILNARPAETILKESIFIDEFLKGQKMFKHKGIYLPLNFKLLTSSQIGA